MKLPCADLAIVLALLGLPLFGAIEACGNNGPIAPGSPGDKTPRDNRNPVAVLSVVGPELQRGTIVALATARDL